MVLSFKAYNSASFYPVGKNKIRKSKLWPKFVDNIDDRPTRAADNFYDQISQVENVFQIDTTIPLNRDFN